MHLEPSEKPQRRPCPAEGQQRPDCPGGEAKSLDVSLQGRPRPTTRCQQAPLHRRDVTGRAGGSGAGAAGVAEEEGQIMQREAGRLAQLQSMTASRPSDPRSRFGWLRSPCSNTSGRPDPGSRSSGAAV